MDTTTFPAFKHHIFICTNRRPEGAAKGCCASKGSEALHAYMKQRAKELGIQNIRINKSGCLDACEYGPVMVEYPTGTWQTIRSEVDVDMLLNELVDSTNVP